MEVALGLHDEREIYFLRHLLNFLVAWAGAIAVWLLALRRFGDWRPALLAAAFLVFSPRLFAESFYNSKDIVFMAAVAIGLNTAIGLVYLEREIRLPHEARHEELWRRDAVYDVIAVLGWNDSPVQKRRGSAIFLHVARHDWAPTQGCVALPLPDLRRLLAAGVTELHVLES